MMVCRHLPVVLSDGAFGAVPRCSVSFCQPHSRCCMRHILLTRFSCSSSSIFRQWGVAVPFPFRNGELHEEGREIKP